MSSRPFRRPQRPEGFSQIPHEYAVQQWVLLLLFLVKGDVITATPHFKDPGKHGADLCKSIVMSFILLV